MRPIQSMALVVLISATMAGSAWGQTAESGGSNTGAVAPRTVATPLAAGEGTLYYFYGAPSFGTNAFATWVSCTNFGGDKVSSAIPLRFELYDAGSFVSSCTFSLGANANPTAGTFSVHNGATIGVLGCSLNTTTGNDNDVIRVIAPVKQAPYVICEGKAYDTASSPFSRVVPIQGVRVGKKFKNPTDSKS